MEKIHEIVVVRAAAGNWLESAEVLDTIRREPVRKFDKLPSLSVQAEVAVAVEPLEDPRETSKEGKDFAFLDVQLVEPAVVWTKEKGQFDAPKGTKASINLKRHAGLYRNYMNLAKAQGGSLKNKPIVIANLGKRTFKTDKAPKGKATGYEYRIMLLEDLKKLMGKK